MNLRSYDKTTRLLKQAEFAAQGFALGGENNVLVIGILDCTQNCPAGIRENIAFGIRKEHGLPLTFNVPNFNYYQRLNPATAKYARSYLGYIAKSVEALVRTNLLDGVVAIIDNNITGLGVLAGCTQSNCPLMFMPTGLNNHDDENIFTVPGKLATREVKSTELDQIIHTHTQPVGIAPSDTLTTAFLCLSENFGLLLPNGSQLKYHDAATLQYALATGVEAVQRADDIITPKRLISKKTIADSVAQYQSAGHHISGLLQFKYIFDLIDLKFSHDYPSLKGFADTAYVVSQQTAPLTMQGQAWVYPTIADALTALTANAIEDGVIVLQNCVNCDVTMVAKTIMAMHKQDAIAIITDGFCCATDVLTIANITPNTFANAEFANIQNGDQIEIDVAKGRLNLNTSSKDMKLRAKRNIVKKYEIYF